MVVEKGYKQTEAGVIPEDWEVMKIGEFIEFKNGLNKEKKFFGHGTPIINYMDVFNSRGINPKNIYGKVFLNKSEIGTYNAKKGDVFFTRTSETVDEIGITSVLLDDSNDTVFSGFILRGREKSHKLDIEFKKYCFSEQSIRNQIISTASYTTRALTNGRLLSQVLVKIPPLPEQTAIANALSDMDALIAQTEKLIEKKKAIKQGVMQELLKPKDGWVTKKLGEVLQYEQPTKYIVRSDNYSNDNSIPVLTAGKSFILGFTSEEFGVFSDTPTIIFDDFTTASQFVDFKFKVKSSAMKILKPKISGINMLFMFEMLQNIHFPVADHKRHWIGEFQHMEVILPSIEIMYQLGNMIHDYKLQIQLEETKLQKLKNQKQGMMQALLTGKIRLV